MQNELHVEQSRIRAFVAAAVLHLTLKLDSCSPPTRRSGKCWYVHELLKYEFDFEFEIPATYPSTAPEIQIPELDGKTAKMYRGGKICLTVHFKPLWAKNRCAYLRVLYMCLPLCHTHSASGTSEEPSVAWRIACASNLCAL